MYQLLKDQIIQKDYPWDGKGNQITWECFYNFFNHYNKYILWIHTHWKNIPSKKQINKRNCRIFYRRVEETAHLLFNTTDNVTPTRHSQLLCEDSSSLCLSPRQTGLLRWMHSPTLLFPAFLCPHSAFLEISTLGLTPSLPVRVLPVPPTLQILWPTWM